MGTAIAKVGSMFFRAAKTQNIGKLLYSTGGNKGTFLDALIDTCAKPNVAPKLAKQINISATKFQNVVDDAIKPLCKNCGEYGSRIKKTDKIAGKMSRAVKELTVDDAVAYINTGNFTNVIGDATGARIILEDPKHARKFIKRLIKVHNQGKIQIGCVENYHGKGISPYLDDKLMADLQKLTFTDGAGNVRYTTVVNKLKKGGYTRTNMDIYINGKKFELQIGGKHTTRLGEVEHFYYDMGQGALPDLTKLSSEQKQLFFKMRDAYKNVKKNSTIKAKFDDYTTSLWRYAEDAERNYLPFPKFPEPPKGIPNILSGENLMRLEHGAVCNKLLLMG